MIPPFFSLSISYPASKRQPHCTSAITTRATAATAVSAGPGVPGNHRPRPAEASNQGTPTRASIPNRVPLALARKAARTSPRISQAQEVVIPQVGQGRPKSTTNVHGGSPSCSWVPRPCGFGSKARATPNSAANPIASRVKANRKRPESRTVRDVPVWATLIQ